jgi:hypothetical protein
MMKMSIIAACFLMMLTFSFTKSFGQNPYHYPANIPDSYWLDLGAGKSSSGFSSIVWDANAQISDSWFITGRLQGELNSFSSFGFKRGAGIYAYDLLAGRMLNQKFGFLILSTGFGLVDVVSSAPAHAGVYNNSTTTIQTVGVPILIQSYLASLQTFDFGISGYINLNTIRCTAGITLNLAIGQIGNNNKNY